LDLQKTGFQIDLDRLEQVDKKYENKLKKLRNTMWEEAGYRFNPRSDQDLIKLFYDTLGLDAPKGYKTEKTGQPKTDKEVKKILYKKYKLPILKHIIDYGKLTTLKTRYLEGFRKAHINGRVHPKFPTTRTKTGRSASNKPNAQNISKKEDIKGIIIARPNYKLIEMDYKQAEARLFAYLAQSKKLAEVCYSSDVYQKIAAMSEGKDFEEIEKEVRDHYKMVVLAILYGMGDSSLAKTIGKSKRAATKLKNKFFKMFPAVTTWKQTITNELKEKGFVTSIYGRKRRIPAIYSNYEDTRAEAERQAVNFMVQSPTFDFVSKGLCRVYNKIKPYNAKINLTVHDSIIVEAHNSVVDKVIPVMKYEMLRPVPPIGQEAHMGVDIEVGERWSELEKYKIN
jgi:DNA polymerase-1